MRLSYRSPLLGVCAAALGVVTLVSLPSDAADENPCAAPSASASAEEPEEGEESASPSASPTAEEEAPGLTGVPEIDAILQTIQDTLMPPEEEPPPAETSAPEESESAEPSGSAAACTPVTVVYNGATGARYRDIVTFQARVLKDDGTPVSGGTLTFSLLGTNYPVAVGTDGTAVVRGRIIADPGSHTVKARYETAESAGEATAPFKVTKTAALCGIARQVSGNNSRLTGSLKNPDKSPIVKRNTIFAYDDQPLANAATDVNGVSKYVAGRGAKGHVFKVSFRGDTRHTACQAVIKVP